MYDVQKLKKLGSLGDYASEAFNGFVTFDTAAFKAGSIPVKTKELIAIAVAVTTQCPYCISIHSKRAKEAGATLEEIAESVLVAAAIRAGGAVTHAMHALAD